MQWMEKASDEGLDKEYGRVVLGNESNVKKMLTRRRIFNQAWEVVGITHDTPLNPRVIRADNNLHASFN